MSLSTQPSIAGLFLDVVSRVGGTAPVTTGLGAGALRALAILNGASEERIEWMTAAGFAIGAVLGASVLVLDVFLG